MEPRRSAQAAPPAHNIVSADVDGNRSILNVVLAVVLILASVLASVYLASRLLGSARNGSAIEGKKYQALFLTNGQVYFGHLSKIDNGYVRMKDIYYLQVQQQVQPTQNTNNQSPQVSLAKLGSELHGPEDTMYVAREQVLFWENLKDDGKVAQAIKSYQSSKK